MKFRSLKYKVLLWFTVITSIVLFIFSFSLYYLLEESINLRVKNDLYHNAISIHEDISQKKIINNRYLDGVEVAIIRDNKIINKTQNFTLENFQSYFTQNKIFFIYEVDEYKVDAIYILKFNKPFDGAIIVYKKGVFNKAEDIEDILLVLNPIFLIILIFIGNHLIDKILNPIKNITKTAKEISISNFSHTIDIPKNNDEIKELIESFNEMITRLKDGVDKLDRFNSDVSHELRTPLTIIKGELEVTLRKPRESHEYIKSINTALAQTTEMEKLVDALLILTKYSKQSVVSTFTSCNLDSILMDVIDKYTKEIKGKNIEIHVDKLELIIIQANKFLIHSIFSNIIDNAIKYSPNDKNIYISLFKNGKNHLIVKDEGIGIATKQLDKITRRFYRVDESRNKKIKGFGLGLSIVKNSLELHNGILKIDSIEGIGTTVTITL